jgi:hypothetical protein
MENETLPPKPTAFPPEVTIACWAIEPMENKIDKAYSRNFMALIHSDYPPI